MREAAFYINISILFTSFLGILISLNRREEKFPLKRPKRTRRTTHKQLTIQRPVSKPYQQTKTAKRLHITVHRVIKNSLLPQPADNTGTISYNSPGLHSHHFHSHARKNAPNNNHPKRSAYFTPLDLWLWWWSSVWVHSYASIKRYWCIYIWMSGKQK